MIQWWRNHCHPSSWVWREKATVFNITTAEVCKAVLNIDLSDQPLPLGGAFLCFPMRCPVTPRDWDKRLFQAAVFKDIDSCKSPLRARLSMECSPRATCREPGGGAHLLGVGAILRQRLGRELRRALLSQSSLPQLRLGGSDRDYVGSVKEYALAAHNLITPVNIWRIPYPGGHAAVFASPTKVSFIVCSRSQVGAMRGVTDHCTTHDSVLLNPQTHYSADWHSSC